MGITSAEFWRLSPREYAAALDAYKDKMNMEQLGTARLTAMIAGMFGGDGQRAPSYDDFLPFPPPRRRMTVEESAEALRQIAVATGALGRK